MLDAKLLNQILDSSAKGVTGLVLGVSRGAEGFCEARGNFGRDSQFFIASATKLFTTALVLQLVDKKKLNLDDKISQHLPQAIVDGLHVFKGHDSSKQITIENLLCHNSGLPDYFQAQRPGGKSLMTEVLAGRDQKWDLEWVVEDSKKIGAQFLPNSGKALYSDTNFQLLGRIIENGFRDSFSNLIQKQICEKINLHKTYLYSDPSDTRPIGLNYKQKILNIPRAMTSFGSDGGIVSTATECLDFLKGFFEGKLFDPSHIENITHDWRKIFFPLQYGIGISLFRLPWFFSPFKRVPDLVGHSGLSGAFLFFCPEKKVYLAGTTNEISKPQASFRLMVSTLQKI